MSTGFDSVHKTWLKSALLPAVPLSIAFPLARHSFRISQTISVECPASSVTFDEGACSSHVVELREVLVVTDLIWGPYGT